MSKCDNLGLQIKVLPIFRLYQKKYNRNFMEFGAPLQKVYNEGGTSRCVVEGSLLTSFLPAQS